MKNNLKEKLRIAGISLKEIAGATKTYHSAVCNVLDDQLREKVEAKARELLVKKKAELDRELSEID